ncbi:MAG: Ig-like domain-containing protein, partial [Anaerovoracaceae bacterium]
KVGTPIRGSADRAGNTVDPSGQTGRWTVPMTLNFEPNHTYELAFAQGFICNNGVANMISEDGTGYYQRISTDPTDPERIYYEAHKYDESKYREYKYQTYKPSDKPGGKDVYLEDEYINPTEGTLHPMRFSLKTKPISVTGVTLDKASVALEQNETSQLTPTVKPELASDKSVTWTSSDETIATVDETGKITAKSPGKAKVTVTTVDGGFTASCDVLVKGIQINLEKKDLVVGDKIKLSADLFEEEIAGERAVGQKITWTVSNPKVASIEGEYLVAREAGTVTLTATSGDGRYTATVDLQIMNKPVPPTPTPEEPSAPGAVKPVDKDKTPATGDGSMAVSAMMLLVAAAATGIGAAKRAKVK